MNSSLKFGNELDFCLENQDIRAIGLSGLNNEPIYSGMHSGLVKFRASMRLPVNDSMCLIDLNTAAYTHFSTKS